MKKKIVYTDEPISSRVIKDIFPSPEELMRSEPKKRVTIVLSNNSLNFFKDYAKKKKASYQVMIRRLLDLYVAKQQNNKKGFNIATA